MSNRDLELALKIKATAEGLGEIRSTIKELENAGIETETWKEAVNELDDTLAEVARNDALIDKFSKLKSETNDSAAALKQAQTQAQKLAGYVKPAGGATRTYPAGVPTKQEQPPAKGVDLEMHMVSNVVDCCDM